VGGGAAAAALADAIRSYKMQPEMGVAHGTNARRFIAEHFSLDQMVQRYVGLYESIA
jgi:hypothetical protein